MKTLISIQAVYYVYAEFVKTSRVNKLPIQDTLSDKQLEKIFGIIKSATNTVFNKKLYPTIYHQTAFIIYQLNKQHILFDGNKRFSLMLATYILDIHNIKHTKMSTDDWEMLIMRVAADSNYSLDKTAKYIQKKLK